MSQDINDFLFGGGVKSAKFENVGDYVKGRIVSAQMVQQTDFKTKAPKFFSDGQPMMQLKVVLATDLRDDGEDDGQRAIYAKGGKAEPVSGTGKAMKDAIAEAVRKAGGKALDIGSTLTVAFTGLGKADPGLDAPKLFGAKWEPATVQLADPNFDPLA